MTLIQRIVTFGSVVIVTSSTAFEARAGMITYTFEGTISVASPTSVPEPWNLGHGTSGHTFAVSVTYEDQSYAIQSDTFGDYIRADLNNGFVSGTMTLDGMTSNLTLGSLTVYDNFNSPTISGQDYVSLYGGATFNGVSDTVALRVTLDPATYAFSGVDAALPHLAHGIDDFIDHSSSNGYSAYSYDTIAVASALTQPVPEPSSLSLLGMGGLALIGYGLRRKRKTFHFQPAFLSQGRTA